MLQCRLVPMMRSADLDETVGPELGLRLSGELGAALRRRPAQEASLAGSLRHLVGLCERLREASAAALDVLVRRNRIGRPLYVALIRAMVEVKDTRVTIPLRRALSLEDGGGLVTIAAAALSDDSALGDALVQVASSRSPHIAFAAGLARVARGEFDGERLEAIAPRINEGHRIELSNLMFMPLLREGRPVAGAAGALEVLRDSERHLGRWLCIAELMQMSGDYGARIQSKQLSLEGPPTARAAWSLLAWALDPTVQCPTRPTVDVLARLSDRPSAERDLTFLFRMAEAKLPTAKTVLEGLVKMPNQWNELAVRAAGILARDYGRHDLIARLLEVAKTSKCEPFRGLALAALTDCCGESVDDITAELLRSRHHSTLGFAALVRMALLQRETMPIISETSYRRLQLGWPD